jgi:hypothetical protein
VLSVRIDTRHTYPIPTTKLRGMKKPIAARSALIAASAAIVAFKAEGSQTDFDAICSGLTAKFEKCKCTTNPTSSVGYVIDTAFVGCIRPEIEVNVNFTGSDRYLSSISVSQDGLSFRHVDLMMDPNHTVTSCQATSYGRECDCTVCSSPEAGVALDIDCNGNPGGGAASTNGTCSTLLDLFQYSFDAATDGATSGSINAKAGSFFAGSVMSLLAAVAAISFYMGWM